VEFVATEIGPFAENNLRSWRVCEIIGVVEVRISNPFKIGGGLLYSAT
jgi:hypothetical protein